MGRRGSNQSQARFVNIGCFFSISRSFAIQLISLAPPNSPLCTGTSLAESSVSSIQSGMGAGQGLSIEDRLNQWRLSRMQQQQQQTSAVIVDSTRPVLTRSRLENDSPNASSSSAAAKRAVRPASGACVKPIWLCFPLISHSLCSATPALSVSAKAPAPSRLPPPISATPRSGENHAILH